MTMPRKKLMCLFLMVYYSETKKVDSEKVEFCREVQECETDDTQVCGFRLEGKRYRLKIFDDECELMKFGCNVEDDKDAYGIISMGFCNKMLNANQNGTKYIETYTDRIDCIDDCPEQVNNETICGIRQHGDGYKVRLFINQCEMLKYNCEKNFSFNVTDDFICDGLELPEDSNRMKKHNNQTAPEGECEDATNIDDLASTGTESLPNITAMTSQPVEAFGDNGVPLQNGTPKPKHRNLIVVNESMFDFNGNINDTVENFLSSTHVFDMPLKEITHNLNENTRRVMLRVFGPMVVFKPAVEIPKNISTDVWHQPTLASCFHQCPLKCPDTYAPVCGAPGLNAREPSLMFKNHCLMDAVQCKMRWDNDSSTSYSSSYTENSFIFCLGGTLNGLYRFLPLMRTLQHMGRLKKKGNYRIRLRNMRFFNELLHFSPRVMG